MPPDHHDKLSGGSAQQSWNTYVLEGVYNSNGIGKGSSIFWDDITRVTACLWRSSAQKPNMQPDHYDKLSGGSAQQSWNTYVLEGGIQK